MLVGENRHCKFLVNLSNIFILIILQEGSWLADQDDLKVAGWSCLWGFSSRVELEVCAIPDPALSYAFG